MIAIALAALLVQAAPPTRDATRIEAGARRNFTEADVNADGKLDRAELAAMLQGRAKSKNDPSLARPEAVDGLLSRVDTDRSGTIDLAEMIAHRLGKLPSGG